MRLLRAELTKLRRPLTWSIVVAALLASLAFAWQGTKNASAAAYPAAAARAVPTCRDLSLPNGRLCDQAISVQEQVSAFQRRQAATKPSTRHNARPSDALPVEQPLGAAKLGIGFMVSLGGALLIFLLAAGHVGNEWDHRTIKSLLCQNGKRSRVLAAKVASVWIVALAITILDWTVLAAFSPLFKAKYPLPGPALSWSAAWTAVAADAARAPFILAVFAVLGVSAAVIIRNALGAFALAAGVILVSLTAAGNIPHIAPWTIAYWVSGWMQFRSHGFVIYHFWLDSLPASVHSPGALTGFIGLLAVVSVVTSAAVWIFQRDVTV